MIQNINNYSIEVELYIIWTPAAQVLQYSLVTLSYIFYKETVQMEDTLQGKH